jgi:uncharacterized protein YjgD (DUF1641 family)
MGAAELAFVVKAIDHASGTLDNVGGKVSGLGSKFGGLGTIAGGALLGGIGVATAATAGLGKVLVDSFDAASEAENIQAQLNAVLKSTKGAAGLSADAINEMALALSKTTAFEDDAIVSGQNMLLTFTNIGKDVFPLATETMLDMSQALGQDMKSSAMQLGKALNDPVAGMAALQRVGVKFTDSQKDQIKTLVESGNAMEAQKLILQELQVEFGGSAVAAGKTFTGQMEIMKNAVGNVKEEIGNALLPIVTDMLQKFGPKFIDIAQKFADWFTNVGLPALSNFGQWIETKIVPALQKFGEWFSLHVLPVLQQFGDFLMTNIVPALSKFWEWFSTKILPVLADVVVFLVNDFFSSLGILVTWLSVNVPVAIDAMKTAWVKLQPFVETMRDIFGAVGDALGKVWTWLSVHIPPAIEAVKGAFEGARDGILGVIGAIEDAITKIETAIQKIREFLSLGASGIGTNGIAPSVSGGSTYGVTPTNPAGGGGTYGVTPPRAPSRAMGNVTININAPGGNPGAVSRAAQSGVLAAARSMGMR